MSDERLDPITLQVLVGGLRAACDEMGAVLIRSAHSANIKERRDCSTALFDAGGELVMQAEHIPVHLGSMPDAVAAVLDEEQRPGDAWILNDPYRGGTHLPDITLISPLFAGGALLGFAASRAHHADVGGPTPGRDAGRLDATLEEEGVVIPPTRADDDDAARSSPPRMRIAAPAPRRPARPARRQPGRRRRASASWPSASARERAARRDGGDPRLRRAPHPRRARRAPRRRATRPTDVLEGDAGRRPATSSCASRRRSPATRSRSTSPAPTAQVDGNLNCPLSVTKSAAFFAVRVLTDPDAPPSAGAHRPIEVARPRGLPAQRPPPGGRRRRQRRDLEPRRRPRHRGARRRARRCPPRARGR